jgi:hypothetical protein
MKKILQIYIASLIILGLTGCLASTTSPDGVNCNYSQGKPLWEMPLECQGR